MKKKFNFLANLALVSQMGLMMAIPVVMGIWLGGYLDDKFNTQVLFLIIFTLIGVASAFRNVFVMVNKQIARKKDDDDV